MRGECYIMRLPDIKKYNNTSDIEIMALTDIKPVDKTYVVLNDKDKLMLTKAVETIVRRSLEYKQYVQFLKEEIDMTQCAFFKNVTNKNGSPVSIEIHHEPFTLFDITLTVIEKFIDNGYELNPLLIAEEVMSLHYKNMVGLIPLSVTVHELVHDGSLFIPLQNVYGNYIQFLEEYGDYITDSIKAMLETKLRLSKELDNPDTSILEKKYVYLEVEGFSLPQIITK